MKMKVLVNEVENEGLVALMGKRVTLFCGVYIYTGKLVGVNETCVKLEDAGIVYETGSFDEKNWKDCQNLPNVWYVSAQAIESFGELK
jgi:hypothetical protein